MTTTTTPSKGGTVSVPLSSLIHRVVMAGAAGGAARWMWVIHLLEGVNESLLGRARALLSDDRQVRLVATAHTHGYDFPVNGGVLPLGVKSFRDGGGEILDMLIRVLPGGRFSGVEITVQPAGVSLLLVGAVSVGALAEIGFDVDSFDGMLPIEIRFAMVIEYGLE